jgi:hypothetical protein
MASLNNGEHMIDLGPYYSGLRSAGMAIGVVGVTLGVISTSDAQGFAQGLNDIGDGIKLIMKGGGTILAIGLPLYGALKLRLSSKVADVQAAKPEVLATAVAQVLPSQIVAAASALPDVKQITVSNPVLANAAREADPSTNVTVVQAHA